MQKKRILFQNEFSGLSTGFSVMGNGLLKRLHTTDKYELAELATYASPDDPKVYMCPWKVYPNVPTNALEEKLNTELTGQFGSAILERVCLDFKPDFVFSVLDNWMSGFVNMSPFRNNFKFLWAPTVDSSPQKVNWISDYSQVDRLIGYCRYSKEILEEQSGGKLQVNDLLKMGVDHEIFKPLNKYKCRQMLGLPQDANIILTVMRNQRRKLYPDLIEMFRDYLNLVKDKNPELAKKSFLYLHTSYPDVGFDIGRHILQNGISNNIFVTNRCHNCKTFYATKFQGDVAICKRCASFAAHFPNTQYGIEREELSQIYSCADLYIQYSCAEGFGMPVAEAKACGVPVFAVDYSAMREQVEIEGCQNIKVGKLFHEPVIETEQVRALPDNEDCVQKVWEFFNTPVETRNKWSELARADAVENYSFDRSSKVFQGVIDNMEVPDHSETWLNPIPSFAPMNQDVPKGLGPSELVEWCITNILGEPRLLDTYWKQEMVKSITLGYVIERNGRQPFNASKAIEYFLGMGAKKNFWENTRIESMNPHIEDKNKIKWSVL